MKELIETSSSAESYAHKAIKHLVYNYFFNNTPIIALREIEKYFGNRFADVYFQLKSGEKIVVEVQNSKISVKELKQRTQDYNHLGIHVLWLIHGEGNCVASKKYPWNMKNQKISPAEKFLHQMYGGRVYYVNLDIKGQEARLKRPFALHFAKPLKKSKRGIFQSGYDRYFYRDVNFTFIPSWNLLCTQFAGHKIARFYDKNIKFTLKKKMEYFISKYNLHSITKKKQLKAIIKRFTKTYGEYLILNLLIGLVKEKKLILEQKFFRKIQRKLITKLK